MNSRKWFPALKLVALLCCLSLQPVETGKVLVVPGHGSHWRSMKLLVKELTHRGHDMLVLVPGTNLIHDLEQFKTEIYPVEYTQGEVDGVVEELIDRIFLELPKFTSMLMTAQLFVNITHYAIRGCESLLNNQQLMSRLRETSFDLILTDPLDPCGSILARVFSIPTVYFLRGLPCLLEYSVNQCPSPPSFVPSLLSGNIDVMNFPERVKNVLLSVVDHFGCRLFLGHYDEMVSRYFGEDMTYKDLISHGDIWLLRNDFVFEWPRPVMPNMVFIGGINCAKSAPLPPDLSEFVDGSSDDGFIVFTLGSMVPKLPVEKAQQFLDVFGQIPQRVVWRYTGVPLLNVPENIKLMKWLPQNDLLAHSKAKLFITHGGSHGIYESICNAVPMLILPLFWDQEDNMLRMVTRGVAETLNIHDVTTDKLLAAVNKIIRDKSYKERIVELSHIHLDRPLQPMEQAVFWTEFVIRHKGAAHLRVAAHQLTWVQYHSLDIIGCLIVALMTALWVTLKCCLFCVCYKRGRAKTKSE
ncbi:UDP-glucuronosyltransferase-like [Solea senegalensis]|uniref:UDP-glucuronosyltransferase n=1 Tax=Solea senegalensis TaxID=28829 RepID=A0AAV6SYS4_SOLSE|nr:UDP-glucuronosyltransferase-like [Solea senegalensis]KAG7522110.1 UDP-glucuronosyltransferase-like [Solea senegalensis]